MRRKDRQCQDPEFFDDVFARAEMLSVAMHNDDYPYCLPFNFVRKDSKIYIHSAKSGLKLQLIEKNPNVSFTLCIDMVIDRQKSSTYYKSVCGKGKAEIVLETREKQYALDLLAEKYHSQCPRPASKHDADRVSIICIGISELTGKQCLPETCL